MSKRTLLKFVEIVFCSQVELHKLCLQGFFVKITIMIYIMNAIVMTEIQT